MKLPHRIEKIVSLSGDPRRAEADIARFDEAYEKKIGCAFSWESGGAEILVRVFGNSPALSNRLIANPVWADEIPASPYFHKRKPRDVFEKELHELSVSSRTLRLFKYREMMRIVLRDLAKIADTREMLSEWSDLADTILIAAYSVIFKSLSEKSVGEPCAGAVIALGKLGGRELNLSSDIDVLFIYETDDGVVKYEDGCEITNHEFFVRLAADFTKSMQTATDDGFLFRVDNELRPEGHQGALANSLDAAIRYYEHFGQNWERQSLIRARATAGDIALGEKFVRGIAPFVYRRSVTIADIAHMREMKFKMADRALLNPGSFDIKHSKGGIREAEFFVQALLLLHGGTRARLRRQNTFDAASALAEESLLSRSQALELIAAYSFLRRLENMVQAEDDIQTHILPAEPNALFSLARRMGYREKTKEEAMEHFKSDLKIYTACIGKFFDSIFEEDYNKFELKEAIEANISNARNEEEEADSLAWFARMEMGRIAHLDIEEKLPIKDVLKKLSLVAEVSVSSAWKIAAGRLSAKHETAGFAVIGMGKLGSLEMDYGSDLDLSFIYSSKDVADNVEFFTRLAQRILSLVSLPTRYGRAYLVDSELRPSGNSGALVTSLDSFADYHRHEGRIWERLALLKARVIAGDKNFMNQAAGTIKTLAFELPTPPADEIKKEIVYLHNKSMMEKSPGRENSFNIKRGVGGLNEIEAAVQYRQLTNCHHSKLLHRQNTFEILDALFKEGFVGEKEHSELLDCLSFMRRLLAHMRLVMKSSTDTIDFGAGYSSTLAKSLGYTSPKKLEEETIKRRKMAQAIYRSVFGDDYSA